MTTMMKRILAILCSLVMLFSALPFAAAAEKIAAKPTITTDQIISLKKEDFPVKRIGQEKEKDVLHIIKAKKPSSFLKIGKLLQ